MTFTRYRYLMEEYEDTPSSDDILAAVHLPKHRRKYRHLNRHIIRGGDSGGELLAAMFRLTKPGETRVMSYSNL